MAGPRLFQNVGGAKVGRSVFDLSYEKKFTADVGNLYPIMCDEVVPGDIFQMSNQVVIRFQPLVSPLMHEVNAYIHYFFVPYRLLWDEWEDFITGGEDGEYSATLPTWNPTTENTRGSLWEHLGFPVGIDPDGAYPVDFPRRAYNFIYNEYYRDQNLITEVAETNTSLLKRAYEKDYFGSSLPFLQRGTAPALPITGSTSAIWDTSNFIGDNTPEGNMGINTIPQQITVASSGQVDDVKAVFDNNTVDLSNATTFTVNDLRLAFQIQRWLERNARAGSRYKEFLQSHFGYTVNDQRLQRPEYIGGSKSPIIISEVLQTSETNTSPQGTLAGHGISVSQNFVGKKRVEEFGLIMGIMSVIPRASYSQGINRQWLRETKYDFYFPEFAHLGEQGIKTAEVYASSSSAANNTVFGYQGRYDEMRVKHNMVAGELSYGGNLNYWTLSREFGSTPLLNQSFIECDPTDADRAFAVPSEPQMVITVGNLIKAVRPMPFISNPGLIDHV